MDIRFNLPLTEFPGNALSYNYSATIYVQRDGCGR